MNCFVVGLTRISTGKQDLQTQKLAILEYAQKEDIKINQFVEKTVSSRKTVEQRGLVELFQSLGKGDTIIVAELSRLGRSLGQVLNLVNELIDKGVNLISIKEKIRIDGKMDLQTKVMISMIGLFAELERDFIAERTREGLLAAKANGKTLGRPRGSKGHSILDDRHDQVRDLLQKGVSVSSLSKIMGVGRTTMHHFIKSRSLA